MAILWFEIFSENLKNHKIQNTNTGIQVVLVFKIFKLLDLVWPFCDFRDFRKKSRISKSAMLPQKNELILAIYHLFMV